MKNTVNNCGCGIPETPHTYDCHTTTQKKECDCENNIESNMVAPHCRICKKPLTTTAPSHEGAEGGSITRGDSSIPEKRKKIERAAKDFSDRFTGVMKELAEDEFEIHGSDSPKQSERKCDGEPICLRGRKEGCKGVHCRCMTKDCANMHYCECKAHYKHQDCPARPQQSSGIEKNFLKEVWVALKGDHNNLRREAIILRAFRTTLTSFESRIRANEQMLSRGDISFHRERHRQEGAAQERSLWKKHNKESYELGKTHGIELGATQEREKARHDGIEEGENTCEREIHPHLIQKERTRIADLIEEKMQPTKKGEHVFYEHEDGYYKALQTILNLIRGK